MPKTLQSILADDLTKHFLFLYQKGYLSGKKASANYKGLGMVFWVLPKNHCFTKRDSHGKPDLCMEMIEDPHVSWNTSCNVAGFLFILP